MESALTSFLELVGLDPDDYRDRYPAELSGGQQRRVEYFRAMAADPRSCSWTSPSARSTRSRASGSRTSSSTSSRTQRRPSLRHHDIDEAIKMGDKIAILKLGGFLAQYDTPENAPSLEPELEFVASFVGNDHPQATLAAEVEDMDL